MDVKKLIDDFAANVASQGQSEKDDIQLHIQQFHDKLAALPEIDFFAIHIRHPLLINSRASLAIPMPRAVTRTRKTLEEILGNEDGVDDDLAFRFHDSLLDIYFKLIGRSDSFSDSVLRSVGHPAAEGRRSIIATFSFIDPGVQSISCKNERTVLRILVDRELRFRLLGWDGHKGIRAVTDNDCKLLQLFYRVIFDEIGDGNSSEDTLIENARDELERKCFFASREAFISSEAAKLVRGGKSKAAAELAFKRLFEGNELAGNPKNSHSEQLSRLAQILAMVQSVGIYSPVSSEEFAIYAFKPETSENPFAHGITLGGKNLSDVFLSTHLREAQSLIQNLNDKLVYRYKETTRTHRKPIQEAIKLENDQRENLQSQLSLAGLSLNAYDCLVYVADHLLGMRHENDPLSFRIAVGTDETLRQFFEPVTRESSILSEEEAEYSVVRLRNEDQTQEIRNGLLRILAIIEGNYSFAQDESLYLCFAHAAQGLSLRYLARFHPRLRRQFDSLGKRPASRIAQIERLSGISRGVLFAFLESNDTGYIALHGELWGIGNKRSNPRWKLGPQKGELASKLRRLLSSRFEDRQVKTIFLPKLCAAVEQIADTPGKGATFVIGKWNGDKNLKTRCQKMTAVFEMVEEWRLHEVDEVVLYQAAIQDGAIVIGTDTNTLYCRRQLVAVDDAGLPFDPERWPSKKALVFQWNDNASQYYWPKSGNWYKWGTRHRSAASLAYVGARKFTVVCLSSDTAVHLFDGQEVHELRP